MVILSEDVSLERRVELRSSLGSLWNARKITFRSGTPLRLKHLERVDFENASAIILPGAEFAYGSANESDTLIVKTVLSIENRHASNGSQSLPLLVTELFDSNKILMAQKAYRGILEILATHVFIARCMAQNIRHPRMSHLFHQILFNRHGNSIYIRNFESYAGFGFGDIANACQKAVLLGVVRPNGDGFRSMLNPSDNQTLESGDRLVFLARVYEDCEILKNFPSKQSPVQSQSQSQTASHIQIEHKRHILMLGWNYKVAALIKELDDYLHEQFEVSTLSLKPSAEREAELRQKGIDQNHVKVSHYEGDYTFLSDLKAIHPGSFDNVVIFGRDWLETQEESDARTIVGHLVLRNILEGATHKPKILVELMDDGNIRLFQDENTEVLVTPMIASHVLAQVALRRELNTVYAELFGASGAEIIFRPVSDYGSAGKLVSFQELKGKSKSVGEIALGFRSICGRVLLNPIDDTHHMLEGSDDLIVLVQEDRP